MVSVTTTHNTYKLNPSDIVTGRFYEYKHKYLLYIMERNGSFRIGKTCTSLNRSDGRQENGIGGRVRMQQCDKLWILDIYDTEKDALFYELLYSHKFNIPQTRFINNKLNTPTYIQENLDMFFSTINNNQLKNQVIKLFKKFNRDINYPYWSKDNVVKMSDKVSTYIHPNNIIPNKFKIKVKNRFELVTSIKILKT